MVRIVVAMVAAILLLPLSAIAEEQMTAEQIRQVIAVTDAAAKNRDAETIGKYLSERFAKNIEVPVNRVVATVRLNKQQYLDMIESGWEKLESYDYRREDLNISIAADGRSGESRSSIAETVVMDGREMVSKVREYARYELEQGRVVITTIEGITLVGDTMPETLD